MAPADARRSIAVLRGSHERLRELVEPLDGETLRRPSYDDGWSIAQVLSHLGSQAEIMDLILAAALSGSEPPARDVFPPIWGAWDARTPEEQRDASLAVNDAHVGRLEAMSDDELAAFHVSLFGVLELDADGLARVRLAEHAVHTWDIAVALDPAVTVAPDAVDLLVDWAADLAVRLGKPQGTRFGLRIDTTDPDRSLALVVDDTVAVIGDAAQASDGRLSLPAEAFLRLVYGRLDPEHSPVIELDAPGLTLDDVRAVFPGV